MTQQKYPFLARRLLPFFRWFCHPDYVEDIEGDLLEKYQQQLQINSKRKADWWLNQFHLKTK